MSENFPNSYEGYTGHLAEGEIFERCPGSWDAKTYFDFPKSVEYVKNNQPADWRVSDPKPRLAGDLFANVAEKLDLDDWEDLKLYTAVGTPLDLFHGTDAFFEYEGTIVTIDLTINDKKQQHKADFVINPGIDDLEVIADAIVSRMKNRKARAA